MSGGSPRQIKVITVGVVQELLSRLLWPKDSRLLRILDVGCHRGEHIEQILHPMFPQAEIVGVEPKQSNLRHCAEIELENVRFVEGDCRDLRQAELGTFDFVWCFGLLYHLDDPSVFFPSIERVTHEKSIIMIDTHIATVGEQAYHHSLSELVERRLADGGTYRGKVYREFPNSTPPEERDLLDLASVDNPTSFWLTNYSLLKLLGIHGYGHVFEVRSVPTLWGPGLRFLPIDPDREWGRRCYFASRAPLALADPT